MFELYLIDLGETQNMMTLSFSNENLYLLHEAAKML